MSILKGVVASLAALLLIVCLSLWAMLNTELGLTALLALVEKMAPAFKADDVKGNVLDGFVIKGLRFENPTVRVNVDTLSSKLRWSKWTHFTVPYFTVQTPDIVISSSDNANMAASSKPLGRFNLPVSIELTSLIMTQAKLLMPEMKISMADFSGGATFSGSKLSLTPIDIKGVDVQFVAEDTETNKAAKQSPIASHRVQKTTPDAIKLTLPKITLPIDIQLDSLVLKDALFDKNKAWAINRLVLKASTQANDITLKALDIESPSGKINASGTSTLAGDFPVSLSINARYFVTPKRTQNATLALNGSLNALLFKGTLTGVSEATFQGEVDLTVDDLPFSLMLNSQQLVWPLDKTPAYQLLNNQLSLRGKITDYQVDYHAQFKGEALPEADIALKASGNLQEASVKSLTLDTLSGKIETTAEVRWADKLSVSAEVKVDGVHPDKQWADFKGTINGDVILTLHELTNRNIAFAVKPLLSGKINQQGLGLTGAITGTLFEQAPVEISFDNVDFHHGDNQLTLSGKINNQWSIKLDTAFKDLKDSILGVQGNIHGKINVTGSRNAPIMRSDLVFEKININDTIMIASGKLNGRLSLAEKTPSDLTFNAQQVSVNTMDFEQVDLHLDGLLSRHQVTLTAEGHPLSFKVAVNGQFKNDQWKGMLLAGQGTFGQKTVKLDRKVAVSWSAKGGVNIAKHCWTAHQDSLCLVKDALINDSGHIALKMTRIDLGEWLQPLLTDHQELNAILNADLAMDWKDKRLKTLDGHAALLAGSYQQPLSGTDFNIGWQSFTVAVENHGQLLKGQLGIQLTPEGRIQGNVSIDSEKQSPTLTGNLQITQLTLDKLKPLLPFYHELRGDIDSHIQLGGTLSDPVVNGNVRLVNVRATGENAPFIVDSGQCVINFDENKANINAEFMNEEQPLTVKGDMTWRTLADWQLTASIYGNKLKVQEKPMVRLELVPNLSITANANSANIEGKVDIPSGLIQVKKLPDTAVSVSRDEVIIKSGTRARTAKAESTFELQSLVNLNIGDDVKIDALGLKANLTGNLLVKMKGNQPMLFGDLFIEDGTYRAFGQDLIIQKGRLLFNGPPDQPYLSIKAIRNPKSVKDDVIAGVQVTGPADKPKIDFFSAPSMPQQNIISYLLTGKDIGEDTDANSAMTIMLISMGLSKSNRMVSSIGDKVGIKGLALSTEGGGVESQVTVSGYIAPGLQVKYGVGVFKTITEFTVRYQLMRRLFLEVVSSSEDSSLDLLYQFSFGHVQKPVKDP